MCMGGHRRQKSVQWGRDFCYSGFDKTTDGCNEITPRVEGWEAPLRPGPGVEVSQPGGGVQGAAPHHARARGRVLDTACTHISILSSIYPVSFNSTTEDWQCEPQYVFCGVLCGAAAVHTDRPPECCSLVKKTSTESWFRNIDRKIQCCWKESGILGDRGQQIMDKVNFEMLDGGR